MDKRLILLIALALVGSGAFAAYNKLKKPDRIEYAIGPLSAIKTGDSIAYEGKTSSASRWKWDFGDGEFSAARKGNHTYLAPGTYTVTLTAFGPFGMQQRSEKVNVLASEIVPAPPAKVDSTPIAAKPVPAPVQKPVVTASAKPMAMPPAQNKPKAAHHDAPKKSGGNSLDDLGGSQEVGK